MKVHVLPTLAETERSARSLSFNKSKKTSVLLYKNTITFLEVILSAGFKLFT